MSEEEKEEDMRQRGIAAARRMHQKDAEVEIDDNAKLSIGDDPGFWVAAWVWVNHSDLVPPVERKEDEEESA